MKYQKPQLAYLAEATASIQGVHHDNGKVNAPVSDATKIASSSVDAYGEDE